MKHTAGEWESRGTLGSQSLGGPGPYVIESWLENGRCEQIATTFGIVSSKQDEVNAKLIAAAPDLLAALERLIEVFDPDKQATYEFARDDITAACAAVAKAHGECVHGH